MSTTDTGSPDEPDEAGSRRSADHERAGSTPQTADTTELEDDDDDDDDGPVREAKSRDAESPGAFIDDPNPPEPNEPG